MNNFLACLAALAAFGAPALAMSEQDLRAALEQRFHGDRTGACIAAAVIDSGITTSAYVCSDARSARPIDERTAFEIGSVSKTMTAALLAEFIGRGDIALDDPLAKLLPAGTIVPTFNGKPITVRHIVTHTSGLPSFPWPNVSPLNPYAKIKEADLLGTLAKTKLDREPGTRWSYSNFAMMVLSYALAKRSGKDYESLLRERLLAPLGMANTYITQAPPKVRAARGHLSNAMPTGPWDFPVDMAGAGGVRATLPDMVRYVEGQLGVLESQIRPAMWLTQQEVSSVDGHTSGMNWSIQRNKSGRTVFTHEGGTGGFSSLIAFDRASKFAVILLSDTSVTNLGGLSMFTRHLFDPSVPAGEPRTVSVPDPKLITALVGRYRLSNGLGLDLRRKGNALTVQADGQPEFELGHDSAGDFYPLAFDALMRPRRIADGSYVLTWFQDGGALGAVRINAPRPPAANWMPSAKELEDYVGNYPLTPNLALRVFSSGPTLSVQGTGQKPFEVAAVEMDDFVAEAVGAEIIFERDAIGKVIALKLKQGGQVLRGERH